MLENKEGQRVPQVTFRVRDGDQWVNVSSDDIFKGKTVVLFALPGAFTPSWRRFLNGKAWTPSPAYRSTTLL